MLTDEGFAALETAAPDHVESVRIHLFDELSPEQQVQLREISDMLLDHLLPIVAATRRRAPCPLRAVSAQLRRPERRSRRGSGGHAHPNRPNVSAMDDLEGKGAVVVGGGSGVGRGIAMGLAAAGAQVVVADIDPESANAVRDEIEFHGGASRAGARSTPPTPASLEALARAAVGDLGKVHVLVNCVGVVADTPLTSATEAEWAWFIEFHLMTAVRAVNAVLPAIRAHGEGGHIVLTSSMAGLLGAVTHDDPFGPKPLYCDFHCFLNFPTCVAN